MARLFHLSLLFTLAAPLSGDDWLMYLRDPAHTSFNGDESRLGAQNVAHLRQTWKVNVGAPVASAVTVSQGQLFFGDWAGNFYSMNAADGSVNWASYTGMAPHSQQEWCMAGIGVTSQPTIIDGMVYVGGGDSAVYAFNRDTGEQVWRAPLADPASGSYIWSSMVFYNGALYVGIASLGDCPLVRGALIRIDPNDPTHPLVRYLAPEGQTGGGIWSTPAFDAETNTVYVTTGTGDQDEKAGMWGGSFLALDADTLEVKAHYFLPSNSLEMDIEWGSSPTLFKTKGGASYVVANGKDGVMYTLNRSDLSLAWTLKIAVECISPELGCGSISTPAFDGTTLFTGAGVSDVEGFDTGTVYAVDSQTGSILWRTPTEGVVIAPVTVANGLIYASTSHGVVILDAPSGKLLWSDPNGLLYSQPVVVDGTLYSTYVNGDVIAWGVPE